MDSSFLAQIVQKHLKIKQNATDLDICSWAQQIYNFLFPAPYSYHLQSQKQVQEAFQNGKSNLIKIIGAYLEELQKNEDFKQKNEDLKKKNGQQIADNVYQQIHRIYKILEAGKVNQIARDTNLAQHSHSGQKNRIINRPIFYDKISKCFHKLDLPGLAQQIQKSGYQYSQINIEPVKYDINLVQHVKQFEQLIGNTPMVQIKKIFNNPKIKILAKLEGNNPCGSIKDRPALYMVKQAFKRGDLKPGMKVIEITSGNTGIALSMIARLYGFQIELVMPDWVSIQRTKIMQAFGAKVHSIKAESHGFSTMKEFVEKRMKQQSFYFFDQFNNPDNTLAHYQTTGPEIFRDTQGKITHFVASMGTTGTVMGAGKYLKEKNKNIRVIGVQPAQGQKIQGTVHWHPCSHNIPKLYKKQELDELVDISSKDAQEMTRRLAKEEGIFSGPSSGASLIAAIQQANKIQQGIIVFIICDRGDRYLSTPIFQENQKS